MNDSTEHTAPLPNARLAMPAALLATGLLAGTFLYGWANVTPTFDAVPIDVHLAFRTELMRMNSIVMQSLMLAAFLTCGWCALALRGPARAATAGGAVLAVATFLVTRFGNVPINQEMKVWAAGALAVDYQDRLAAWDLFNDIRVTTALCAFALVILAADLVRRTARTSTPVPTTR
ncbi:anthrone oxygenase family protein [Rhodococcus daqingensis]|uniref:Anthrone oxygenase family protein n=1 Tax=Rhodococcus daqingensis TaxID=2479363 RepID=A0ABW2RSR5_9NOCA